jgi:hypothetical protein
MNVPIYISIITSFTYSLLGHLHYYIAFVRQLKSYVEAWNNCTILFGLERSDYVFHVLPQARPHDVTRCKAGTARSSLAPSTNRIFYNTQYLLRNVNVLSPSLVIHFETQSFHTHTHTNVTSLLPKFKDHRISKTWSQRPVYLTRQPFVNVVNRINSLSLREFFRSHGSYASCGALRGFE